MNIYDERGTHLTIGDRVEFSVNRTNYDGVIRNISRNGSLMISSYVGEFYRNPRLVRKLGEGNHDD